MSKIIVCSVCARPRDISKYATGKQKHIKSCNDCYKKGAHYHRGLCTEVSKPRYQYKQVKCLRCNKSFLGGVNIRICEGCKKTNEYQDALWFL